MSKEMIELADAIESLAALDAHAGVGALCARNAGAIVAALRASARLLATPDITDPNVVHVNMLRGTIAKPTWEQIKHLYPEQAAAPTREEYATVLAQELWCGATFADAAPSEREAFLRAVDAILALKPAPAK